MKTLLAIFIEQIHSGELWKRFWDFNKLKPFKGWTEYREQTSKRLTIEDVPALILTGFCGIVLIGALYLCSLQFNVGRVFAIVIILAFVVINSVPSIKDKKPPEKPERRP
jgi:uncharacterized protein (DUF983 family)